MFNPIKRHMRKQKLTEVLKTEISCIYIVITINFKIPGMLEPGA
jgi:hypothetical protein